MEVAEQVVEVAEQEVEVAEQVVEVAEQSVEVAEQVEMVISIDDDQLPSPEATSRHGRSLRSEPEGSHQ